jgi:predicted CXXCH cytochrome family protein
LGRIIILAACIAAAGMMTALALPAEEQPTVSTTATVTPFAEVPNPTYTEVAVDPNADNDYCLQCHGKPGFSNGSKSLAVDKDKFASSIHHRMRCLYCHYYIEYVPHREPFPTVTCTSACHNLPPDFKPSPTAEKLAEVQASVHAQTEEGAAGICVKCHDPHGSTTPKQWTKAQKKELCVQCHADTALMYAHSVDWDRPAAYDRTYHNKFLSYGNQKVAVCSDCHGAHKILDKDDPASSINAANVTKTCAAQDCHPDAGGSFGLAGGHVRTAGTYVDFWQYGLDRIFFWLIVIVVGMLYAHVILEAVRKTPLEWRERKQNKKQK